MPYNKGGPDIDMERERKMEKQTLLKKASHKNIERRYRANLNDAIRDFIHLVPGLSDTSIDKLNKPTILKRAQEYIKHITNSNSKLSFHLSYKNENKKNKIIK